MLRVMATTTKSTAHKSAESGVENKSLEQAAAEQSEGQANATGTQEPEPPAPNRLGNVHIIVAHPLRAGLVGDDPAKPGDKATVKLALAKQLVSSGAARYAESE